MQDERDFYDEYGNYKGGLGVLDSDPHYEAMTEEEISEKLLDDCTSNIKPEEIPEGRCAAVEKKNRETKVYVANTLEAEKICDEIFKGLSPTISEILVGNHFPVDTSTGSFTTINDGAFIQLFKVSPCRVCLKDNKETVSIEAFVKNKSQEEIEIFAEDFDRKDMIDLIVQAADSEGAGVNKEYIEFLETELDGKQYVDPFTYVEAIFISGNCIINQYNDRTLDFVVITESIKTRFESYNLCM